MDACRHEWTQSEEHKAYPGSRKLMYNRLVYRCVKCGVESRTGWRRILKASVRKVA